MNTKRFTLTTLALTTLIGGVATAPVHAQPFAHALAGGGLSPDQQERADELTNAPAT
jgi:hypothetical protein